MRSLTTSTALSSPRECSDRSSALVSSRAGTPVASSELVRDEGAVNGKDEDMGQDLSDVDLGKPVSVVSEDDAAHQGTISEGRHVDREIQTISVNDECSANENVSHSRGSTERQSTISDGRRMDREAETVSINNECPANENVSHSRGSTERQNTMLEGRRVDKGAETVSINNECSDNESTSDSRDNSNRRSSRRRQEAEEAIPETRSIPSAEKTSTQLFGNEYFEIGQSQTAGLGAIAVKALKEGDVILRERPLFTATASDVFEAFGKLTRQDKAVAMSLHVNEMLKPGTPRELAVWKTNCFAVTNTVAGLFPVASRFNHACHPSQNVDFSYDQQDGVLLLSVRAKHISAGEELKISYGVDRTPKDLYDLYGFRCQCGTCSGLKKEYPADIGSPW